jgi:hypothetical protein
MKVLVLTIVICFMITISGRASSAEEPVKASATHETKAPKQERKSLSQTGAASVGIAAMKKAAKSNKYLFVLCRKTSDDKTVAMRKVLDTVMKDVTDRADVVQVDVTAPSEKRIVDRFDLAYAPMPLLLAIAPNGAVTGGYPTRVEAQDLKDAFVSPITTQLLKAFQDQKLLFLCVQNSKTEFSKEAMQGVRAFKQDERFAADTEIIVVDPVEKAESQLLSDLRIDPETEEAVTVFFAPRRGNIGQFRGATNLDELVATLVAAMTGCGSCGPGGCGPSGCGPGAVGP